VTLVLLALANSVGATTTAHSQATLAVLGLASWVGAIYTAHVLGARKGYYSSWLWGFFLAWLGVIIVACKKPRYEKRKERALGEDRRWAELVRKQAEIDRQRAR
jgi:hypothetical protein